MKQSNFEISVIVKNKHIREYVHENQVFVEGRKGSNFELEFINGSPNKVLIVPSVDGFNTLDGTPATVYGKGYVVSPLQKLQIPGWTLDSKNVAKFIFCDKIESYAQFASPTKDKNTGVLGFLVFAEKINYNYINQMTYYPYTNISSTNSPTYTNISSTNSPTYTMSSNSIQSSSITRSNDSFSLGTGFGSKSEFSTNEIIFIRGHKLAELTLYYSNKRGLNQRGIDTSQRCISNELPSAFQTGCNPPPNWKG